MTNFVYNTPTKVVFGKDAELQTGTLAKTAGATKALVHFGGQSAVKSGLVERICAALAAEGIAAVQLGGVVPNPHLSLVYEGITLCKKEKADFIVAVGGGSVIDSAKAIAYGVAAERDVWDFFSGAAVPAATLPVGAVLTIAAAGSEMSNSSVITNEKTGEKRGCNNELGRCVFAVMNPALTLSVPAYPTACGCADIMMHTLERYFTPETPMQLTDTIAEGLLRTVMDNAQILARDPANLAARAEIMWAGSLSHNGLTACGSGDGDWAPHQLAHEISGEFDTAHGAALTAIWGSWAKYVYRTNPARFAQLALEVLGHPDEGSEEEMALAAIEDLESFFWGLDLPTSFAELDIDLTDELAGKLADGCSRGGTRTIGAFQPLTRQDMAAIYKNAK